MAGKIVVSTLNNDTGVLATQNGMTGIAKAWVLFNGTAGTITNSFNVGSITKNGTGDYSVNFTTAMPNANYAISACSSTVAALNSATAQTTSLVRVIGYNSSFSPTDSTVFSVAVFSS